MSRCWKILYHSSVDRGVCHSIGEHAKVRTVELSNVSMVLTVRQRGSSHGREGCAFVIMGIITCMDGSRLANTAAAVFLLPLEGVAPCVRQASTNSRRGRVRALSARRANTKRLLVQESVSLAPRTPLLLAEAATHSWTVFAMLVFPAHTEARALHVR
jgi:hypothetical protein